MTKKDVLTSFRELWADAVKNDPSLRGDTIAKQQYWNAYTDLLCEDRQITKHQYSTWSNPF